MLHSRVYWHLFARKNCNYIHKPSYAHLSSCTTAFVFLVLVSTIHFANWPNETISHLVSSSLSTLNSILCRVEWETNVKLNHYHSYLIWFGNCRPSEHNNCWLPFSFATTDDNNVVAVLSAYPWLVIVRYIFLERYTCTRKQWDGSIGDKDVASRQRLKRFCN